MQSLDLEWLADDSHQRELQTWYRHKQLEATIKFLNWRDKHHNRYHASHTQARVMAMHLPHRLVSVTTPSRPATADSVDQPRLLLMGRAPTAGGRPLKTLTALGVKPLSRNDLDISAGVYCFLKEANVHAQKGKTRGKPKSQPSQAFTAGRSTAPSTHTSGKLSIISRC